MNLLSASSMLITAFICLPQGVLHNRAGFQPQPVPAEQAAGIVEGLNRLSDPLNTHLQIRDARYVVPF